MQQGSNHWGTYRREVSFGWGSANGLISSFTAPSRLPEHRNATQHRKVIVSARMEQCDGIEMCYSTRVESIATANGASASGKAEELRAQHKRCSPAGERAERTSVRPPADERSLHNQRDDVSNSTRSIISLVGARGDRN